MFLETPCAEWILDNLAVQDFFYEHCNYFSAASLHRALEGAGFAVGSLGKVFDGQYLFAEARINGRAKAHPPNDDGRDIIAKLARLAERQRDITRSWAERLKRAGRGGDVVVWGAGGKGVTFVHLVDPTAELVTWLVDINPAKNGRFTPVTGHPVVSPGNLAGREIATVVVMNPRYRGEIEAELRRLDISAEIQIA